MNRFDYGQMEMDSALALILDRMEDGDGIDFKLSRHGFGTQFWVTRLHGFYYVASSLYAPRMEGINPEYPGERFDNIESAWAEMDSQLDK
jgi:hypothetical protein